MTQLTWNNDAGRYQAQVEGVGLVEVDGDTYAEDRREMMVDFMRARNLGEKREDLDDLPKEVYNTLYDEAEHQLESAEVWLAPPMAGLYINGVDRSEK